MALRTRTDHSTGAVITTLCSGSFKRQMPRNGTTYYVSEGGCNSYYPIFASYADQSSPNRQGVSYYGCIDDISSNFMLHKKKLVGTRPECISCLSNLMERLVDEDVTLVGVLRETNQRAQSNQGRG